MRISYISIIFLIFISIQINAEEEYCDILCKAGVEGGPLELKDKKEPKDKKSYKISNIKKLLISDAQTTQSNLNYLMDSLNEILELDSSARFSAEISISSGDRHNLSIKGIKVFFKNYSEKYTLLEIDEISCSDGKYTGTGINDAQPYLDYYDFKIPDIEYFMQSGECDISGMDLNLPIIFGLSGIEYNPSTFDVPVFGLIEQGSSDIDINSSVEFSGDKVTAKVTLNLANQLSFSLTEAFGFESEKIYQMLETLRTSILIETGFTEEDIVNRRQEFIDLLVDGFILDGYLLEELADEFNYFNLNSPQKFYEITTEVAWSDDFFSHISRLSNGVVDGGMLALKAYTFTRMNKSEFLTLMETLGLDASFNELQVLYGDIFYNLYWETFDEIKKFTENPEGLGVSIDSPNGIDNRTLMGIEENPTLIFTILNNTNFKIYANPRIN